MSEILNTVQSLSWPQLVAAGLGSLISLAVATVVYDYWKKGRSPLRTLRSPDDRANLIFGHLGVVLDSENNGTMERWAKELGDTFAYKGLLNVRRLVLTIVSMPL